MGLFYLVIFCLFHSVIFFSLLQFKYALLYELDNTANEHNLLFVFLFIITCAFIDVCPGFLIDFGSSRPT